MNSKQIIEFIKKHQTKILIIFLVFFLFRSCINARTSRKLEKSNKKLIQQIDSLNVVIITKDSIILTFPEQLRLKSLSIHQDYDLWISQRDRGPQLMELHTKFVKPKIQELSK